LHTAAPHRRGKKRVTGEHKPLNSYVSLNTTADSSSDHAFPVFGFETTFDPSDAIIDREAVRLTSDRINAALSVYERQVLSIP
jgi:hypothetical protein